jgi:hypothetical protein
VDRGKIGVLVALGLTILILPFLNRFFVKGGVPEKTQVMIGIAVGTLIGLVGTVIMGLPVWVILLAVAAGILSTLTWYLAALGIKKVRERGNQEKEK